MANILHMTKTELVDFLKTHGEPHEGTKPDLLLRAEAVVERLNLPPGDNKCDVSDRVESRSQKSSVGSNHSSLRSTLSSLRAKTLIKKAAILAEAKLAEEAEKLELEALHLKQRQRKLQIKTDLAVAEAEEEAVAQAELGENMDRADIQDEAVKRDRVKEWLHKQSSEGLNPESKVHHKQVKENDVSSSLVTLMEVMSLPKTELSTFNGDPTEYWHFMTSFEEAVDSKSISDTAKLNQLLHLCKGDAHEAIKCCAVGSRPDRYQHAKKILKDRFGDEHLIACKWLSTLTDGPALKRGDGRGLQKMADNMNSCSVTLEAMGKLSEMDNKACMRALVERLPPYAKSRWMSKVMDELDRSGNYPGIKELSKLVTRVARESNDPVYEGYTSLPKPPQEYSKKGKQTPARSFRTEVEEQKNKDERPDQDCCVCGQKHKVYMCKEFKQLGALDRLNTARSKKLCFQCLSSTHFTPKCKANACDINNCKGKHSRLLHDAFMERKQKLQTREGETTQKTDAENKNASSFSCAAREITSCPVVKVLLMSSCGQTQVETFAMLDSCSDRSFCSSDLIQQLKLKGSNSELDITTMTGKCARSATTIEVVAFPHNARKRTFPVILKNVHAIKEFPCIKTQAAKRDDLLKFDHMKGIQLEVSDKVEEVKLLIGMNNSDALIPLEVKKGKLGEPFAVRYSLGWTVNGRKDLSNSACFFTSNDLTSLVQRFWSLDVVGTKIGHESVEDREVVKLWEANIKLEEGRFCLPIPFRKDPPCLPDNKFLAKARLKLLHKRLTKNPKLHEKYCEAMTDMEKKGYAERVEQPEKESKYTWYIPHQAVSSQHKPEKIRIVFDCAATYNDVSLNKSVMPGPDLNCQLLGVLLRFREKPVAVCGDIEAMFNQVVVTEEHRDALRFLWFPDGKLQEEPIVYRMTRHLFGGCWSPAAASYALKACAKKTEEQFSNEVVSAINKNFYVDDCLRSVSTEDDAKAFVEGISKLLSEGGFRICKWSSNRRSVLHSIPEDRKTEALKNINLVDDDLPTERTLGLIWDPEHDKLMIRTHIKERPMTKRGLLSVLGSVFDPLGILAPVILKGKILFQMEVRQGKDWDDPLDYEVRNLWEKWQNDLPSLENFSIKRCLVSDAKTSATKNVSLHVFCDASEVGYGTVVYLQYQNSENEICCSFVMSKTRLAPIKTQTIPRLELCAAVLGVELSETIQEESDLLIENITYWTDSSIVLSCIKSSNKRFKTFVANRIARIHELSEPRQWKHVPSLENPADDASRGLMPEQLLMNTRWIQGPAFLLCTTEPDQEAWEPCEKDDMELARSNPVLSAMTRAASEETADPTGRFVEYFSSLSSLCLATAWMRRFFKFLNCKSKDECPSGTVKVSELQTAKKSLIMYVQSVEFTDEIKQVKMDHDLSKKSPLHKLSPILKDGLLCMKGRVERNSNPVILPKSHWLTKLVLRHFHHLSMHGGREHVISLCLQQFWIIGIRGMLKNMPCVHCRRRDGKPLDQRMADLPLDRTTPGYPPFTFVGIDCFGPFLVKRGRSEVKLYGCIFTCLSVRAVHIEVLPSLETDTFLNALQRFISLRGAPKLMRCDNGSNFVGAQREIQARLMEMDRMKIERKMRDVEIEWKFNAPKASNAGGAWERLIRSVRKALYSSLKDQSVRLDEDGLKTAMCLAAAAVNSRPLTTVSLDPKDLRPLSPNDLVLLRSSDYHLPGCWEERDMYRRQYRRVQHISNVFWRRWTREYLPALQERQKWHLSCENLKENDVVLIMDDLPRNQWLLGRVVKVFTGDDGLVRTVEVKTSTSQLIRPVRKLCLLESCEEMC